jgi:hypothetical protein
MRTSRSGESALLLLDVVDTLVAQKVDYAVIGALAAAIHGVVRASMDADVLLSVGVHEAKNLRSAFEEAGFLTAVIRGDFDDPIPGLLKVSDSYGNRVDSTRSILRGRTMPGLAGYALPAQARQHLGAKSGIAVGRKFP